MKSALILIAMLFALAHSLSITEGKYRITCFGSVDGKTNVLDVERELTSDDNPIIVYPWHDGTNQHFTVNYVDGVWATLTAENSGKAITVTNGGSQYVQQTKTNGNLNQQFKFSSTKDGLFIITNRATGTVITCPDNVKTANNYFAAIQGSKTCDVTEKWDFKLLNGGR